MKKYHRYRSCWEEEIQKNWLVLFVMSRQIDNSPIMLPFQNCMRGQLLRKMDGLTSWSWWCWKDTLITSIEYFIWGFIEAANKWIWCFPGNSGTISNHVNLVRQKLISTAWEVVEDICTDTEFEKEEFLDCVTGVE